jgi:hypothetical protein
METVRHLSLADNTTTRAGRVLRTVNEAILDELPIFKLDSKIKAFEIDEEDVDPEQAKTFSERVNYVMTKGGKPPSTFTERV